MNAAVTPQVVEADAAGLRSALVPQPRTACPPSSSEADNPFIDDWPDPEDAIAHYADIRGI